MAAPYEVRPCWRVNPKGGYAHTKSTYVVKRARSGKWYFSKGSYPLNWYDTRDEAMTEAERHADWDRQSAGKTHKQVMDELLADF